MTENKEIIKRLRQFIKHKKMSVREFEHSVGLSNGIIGMTEKRDGSLGADKIRDIKKIYNELCTDWLLLGTGEMLEGQAAEAGKLEEEKKNYHIQQDKNTNSPNLINHGNGDNNYTNTSMLQEQHNIYERLLSAKDEIIQSLKKQMELMEREIAALKNKQ
jgi:hypothetical protein